MIQGGRNSNESDVLKCSGNRKVNEKVIEVKWSRVVRHRTNTVCEKFVWKLE